MLTRKVAEPSGLLPKTWRRHLSFPVRPVVPKASASFNVSQRQAVH